MFLGRWTPFLVTVLAFGQEAVPFTEERINPWIPAWEMTLRGDQLRDPGDPSEDFRRAGIQLRLRWGLDLAGIRWEVGLRSAMGSDSNQDNAERWDQQPSNGTQLDVARATATWVAPTAFGRLSLGFQDNGLVVSQALWDRDLRFLGIGGGAALRSLDGPVQEAGLRVQAGRVRNILGGDVELAAGQLILKADTGPFSWTVHADQWDLSWDAGIERLRALPYQSAQVRQKMTLRVLGAAGTWHTAFPLEVRWFTSKNPDSGETSDESQILVGSRERLYWPEVAFTYQRLSSTGTLYPVNGDEWWYYRKARGPRLDVSLPLPGHWVATVMVLRQRYDGTSYDITRKMLILVKRF